MHIFLIWDKCPRNYIPLKISRCFPKWVFSLVNFYPLGFLFYMKYNNVHNNEHLRMFVNKGWPKKNLTKWNFVFAISQLKNHRNLKILVPTPHNYWGIMWGREGTRIFKFRWFLSREIAKTKFHLVSFFFSHPLCTNLSYRPNKILNDFFKIEICEQIKRKGW